MVWGFYQLVIIRYRIMQGLSEKPCSRDVGSMLPATELQMKHLFKMNIIINTMHTFPQIGTFPLLSSFLTPSDLFLLPRCLPPSCLTLGLLAFSWRWSNPSEQYWTSHSIQTSFFLLLYFFFCSSSLFSFWLFHVVALASCALRIEYCVREKKISLLLEN